MKQKVVNIFSTDIIQNKYCLGKIGVPHNSSTIVVVHGRKDINDPYGQNWHFIHTRGSSELSRIQVLRNVMDKTDETVQHRGVVHLMKQLILEREELQNASEVREMTGQYRGITYNKYSVQANQSAHMFSLNALWHYIVQINFNGVLYKYHYFGTWINNSSHREHKHSISSKIPAVINKLIEEKGIKMNYKKVNYIVIVEATGELLAFNEEEDMNELIATTLEENKKAKFKIAKVTGKIEPDPANISSLIKSV